MNYIDKYKPTSLDKLKGNKSIKKALKSYIDANNPPNIVLTGPYGIGKTLLVKLYIERYFGKYVKTGCFEIYGGLSRGKDVMVDTGTKTYSKQNSFNQTNVLDFIKIKTNLPSNLMKHVIIYEFHQLSNDAQIPIRTLIDKYSKRVRFIILTDNLDEISQALQSRFILLNMKKISNDDIMNVLKKITNKEGLTITSDEYDLILFNADGDLRMAINMLQIFGKIEGNNRVDKAYSILGLPRLKIMTTIIDMILEGNKKVCFQNVLLLIEQGYEINDIVEYLNKLIIKDNRFENQPDVIRNMCKSIFKIENTHSEIQLYAMINNMINHMNINN